MLGHKKVIGNPSDIKECQPHDPYLELIRLNYPVREQSGYATANGKQMSTMLCN